MTICTSFFAFSAAIATNNLSFIWHSRLGYPSNSSLHSLSSISPILQSSCSKDCMVCPLAKQRLSFPFNNKMSNCSFNLIHMDVWGPYSIATLDGFKYFLTMVDDATRATWLFLMKSKSKVK